MAEKKSREPLIRWSNTNIEAITSWFCHKDKKRVAINYHAWTTENHLEHADRMLIHTELHLKPRITKKRQLISWWTYTKIGGGKHLILQAGD